MNMRILIIRFSSIGDIVLTTPVMRCFKLQHPNAEIHYLTKPAFLPLLEHNPYITKVHLLEKKLALTIKELQNEKFDLIIDLHNNLRSFLIKFNLGRKSYSYSKLNLAKWFMTRWKYNILPDTHIVDRYLKTIESIGIINDGKGLDYFIPEAETVDTFAVWGIQPNSYTSLVIGAAHATKRMPLEQIQQLALKIKGPIVLMGGPTDQIIGEVIAAIDDKKIINACGIFSINQSASILNQSKVVVTHDTGLMHIAAALQKKIVSIWGNTIPEFGMYPYYGNTTVPHFMSEVEDLPCRPCSKIGFSECPKKHFNCMKMQDMRLIEEAVNEL
jgi:ADP-heptose:LPS heptosyltransferase